MCRLESPRESALSERQTTFAYCNNTTVVCVRLNTPPGSKLKLIGKVAICSGYLLLYKANCKLLGGRVQSMVESWNLKRVNSSLLSKCFPVHLLLFVVSRAFSFSNHCCHFACLSVILSFCPQPVHSLPNARFS